MGNKTVINDLDTLPKIGMSRFGQFKKFLPLSREKFRQLSKAGKAPRAIRMGSRLTMYSNEELHKFLSNPLSYKSGDA